jgi:YidC/Oxa1 family membrane protein insertase
MYHTAVTHLFTLIIYQPFLNILVFIYWILGFSPTGIQDMGIAVIIFTILIRILMLPLTLNGEQTEKERHEIGEKLREIQEKYAADPIMQEKEQKRVLHVSKRVLFSEITTLFIQVMIALMLWRIFARGLGGEDLHLIYSWMPKIPQPFNLVFLGKFDLTHPHVSLNLLQSLLIFIMETLIFIHSPFPAKRQDVIRYQLTLPIVSFFIFMFLPAGKKLFVITALLFSIGFKLFRISSEWFYHTLNKDQTERIGENTGNDDTVNKTADSTKSAVSQTHT